MDIPDWGTSLLHCLALGDRAMVVLDTGHHAPGTNIEFIVAQLLRAGRLGAFDFNSRFYADDDLMVGSADPFQLFRIMHEIVQSGALAPTSGVNFMLDQCHNIEPKIPGQIRSVMNVQEATAKALLVDADALLAAQTAGDVLGANGAGRWTRTTPTCARCSRSCGSRRGSTPTRSRRTRRPGTRRRSSPSGSAARRRDGEHERRRRAGRTVQPAGGRPADHELRRRATPPPRAPRRTRSPVTDVELLWVKGSGGDLGTLTEKNLAVLRLDRLRALVDVYPGVEREDEMVAAFDYCLHGKGGAAPSIDTAMHALVDAVHVDHLHPDSGIAFATAADGEALTARGVRRLGGVGAVAPARVPAGAGHRARSRRATRSAIGCILGGHGITAWGDTSDEAEERSLHIVRTAEEFIAAAARGGSAPVR